LFTSSNYLQQTSKNCTGTLSRYSCAQWEQCGRTAGTDSSLYKNTSQIVTVIILDAGCRYFPIGLLLPFQLQSITTFWCEPNYCIPLGDRGTRV